MDGTASSTRTRFLAGVGAAAGTVLVGAIIAGLAQGRGDTPAAPSAHIRSTPTASVVPTRAHRAKHKARHAGHKGRHKRG
ncbi:hypothetical protein ETD96_43680 [Actinomadura geliboluensis]|uniref:Uncharacterized protein n=2 Tax=Actinomadura geliboluensis TaxID=882440 RepID=A0A5S4FQH0_9ACTN|nr:hypothetical protein ETD96_43680 [Actinomadura geliboluensis]